ncbi:non-specific serine/threonine protein kinase [Besnoitia besnoiti]|uniref:Non-specific serine/threonine protein kinase n=1 Tax=Besnoitia besnoiti TaxID=94643 RepID=A0A2A9LZW0_BESBE|nr:non-specific serine/threonine protein kinase [Besnoitia besnoiti]PFH31259.1 non-specific serine/threonine protein kinase [Besnoitia besnoiti]
MIKERVRRMKEAQTQNLILREQAQQKRENARQRTEQQRRDDARKAKAMQAKAAEERRMRDNKERYYNHERSVAIRRQQEEVRKKREEEQLRRMQKTQENYEARVAQEEMIRARTEALVAKLEKEEMELIQRLQNTQVIQRSAYRQLDEALRTPATHPTPAKPKRVISCECIVTASSLREVEITKVRADTGGPTEQDNSADSSWTSFVFALGVRLDLVI